MGLFNLGVKKRPKQRRQKTLEKIKSLNLPEPQEFPLMLDTSELNFKGLDAICKRAIVSWSCTQVTDDMSGGEYNEFISELYHVFIEDYNLENDVFEKENKVFSGNYTKEEFIDVSWEHESYIVLLWALGIIDDIGSPQYKFDISKILDVSIKLFHDEDSEEISLDKVKAKCKLRSQEEIMDMVDYYFALENIVVGYLDTPQDCSDRINIDVVLERFRAFRWIFWSKDDWFNLSMYKEHEEIW